MKYIIVRFKLKLFLTSGFLQKNILHIPLFLSQNKTDDPPVGDLCPLTPTTYPFPINNRPKTSPKPNVRNSKTDLKLCLVDAYRPFCSLNRSNLCPELNVVCFVPFPYGQILVMSRPPGSDQRQRFAIVS